MKTNSIHHILEKASPTTEKIGAKEKLSYGVGAFGKDLYHGLIGAYLMIFFTDVAGITAAAAGTIFLISRLFDAVNDPIVGVIVDKTNTRWGKFRPYLLFTPIVLAVLSIALFTIPSFNGIALVVYFLIVYMLWGAAFTAYDVPIMSLAPAITKNSHDRTGLLTAGRIVTIIATGAVSVFALPIVSMLGNGDDAKGYQLFVAILVVFSLLFSWIAFANVKERHVLKVKKNNFKDYVNIIKGNSPLGILLIVVLVIASVMSLSGSMLVYFLSYVLKEPELIPVFQALSLIVPLFFAPFIPIISRKFGKKRTINGMILLAGVMFLLRYFFWSNMSMLVITTILAGIGFIGAFILATSMLADTVDYTEWKTGSRSESVIFSLNSFTIKVGLALAGGVAGLLLELIKYVPNVEQTASTMSGINSLFSLIPGIGLIIALFVMFKYNITEDKFTKIISELEKRNA